MRRRQRSVLPFGGLAVALGAAVIGPRVLRGINVRLSPHFTLGELTTTGQDADNTPGWGHIMALRALAREVLEPIRAELGVPLRITSGYRSAQVNRLVGGSKTSDHMQGTAADFKALGLDSEAAMARIVAMVRRGVLRVDQLIVYHPDQGGHIHVGYRGEHGRGEILRVLADGSVVRYTG